MLIEVSNKNTGPRCYDGIWEHKDYQNIFGGNDDTDGCLYSLAWQVLNSGFAVAFVDVIINRGLQSGNKAIFCLRLKNDMPMGKNIKK